MLNPKENTIDYGESLVPPLGYELSFAVGTTYSLDLEALTILPVALFFSENLDVKKGEHRFDILESITKASKKILVYCQQGKVAVPPKYNFLFSYWEKSVEYITMPTAFQSFHPKVWVMRYEAKGLPIKYKLLITSRNLTYARDWDVAYTSEGEVGVSQNVKSKSIAEFFHYLEIKSSRKLPENFINDLEKVNFEFPFDFNFHNFLFTGISEDKKNGITKQWDELLIISPFVDKKTIDKFNELNNGNKKLSICSRKSELDCLPVETFKNINAFQFSQFIEEAELDDNLSEEAGEERLLQNLHAKIFIRQINNEIFWYLGSANATSAAFDRNIECMVGLKTTNWNLRPTAILKTLLPDDKQSQKVALFERYELDNRPEVNNVNEHELALRELCYNLSILKVNGFAINREETDVYDLKIEFTLPSDLNNQYSIKVKPLCAYDKQSVVVKSGESYSLEEFKDFTLIQLSPYIIWEIWFDGICQKDFMVKMEIDLDDEKRLRKIFSAIINTQEKFLKYLNFLLTGDDNEVIDSDAVPRSVKGKNSSNSKWSLSGVPVYEKLLLAAGRYPEKLRAVDELMTRLKNEDGESDNPIITSEFQLFWTVFKEYIDKHHAKKN